MPVPLLSEPEIAAFKRDGFLVKHGLLDAQLMAQCRARLFRGLDRVREDEPSSWVGPLRPEEETGPGMHGIAGNSRSGFSWKERSAGAEQGMLDLLPGTLLPIAEQLLGKGEVVEATGASVGEMLGAPDDDAFPGL